MNVRNFRLTISGIPLLVSAILTSQPAYAVVSQSHQPPKQAQKVDQFVTEAFPFLKNTTLKSLRNLGKLKQEIKARSGPVHGGDSLNLRTLVFDGLTIKGILHQGELVPLKITVSNNQWEISNGIRIGSSTDSLLSILGLPSRKLSIPYEEFKGDDLTGACNSINVHSRNNIITKLEIFYYFD